MKKKTKLVAALLVGAAFFIAAVSYGAAGQPATVTVENGTVTVSGVREELPNITGLPNNGYKIFDRSLLYTIDGATEQTASVSGGLKGSGNWSFQLTYPDSTSPQRPVPDLLTVKDNQYSFLVSSSDNTSGTRNITWQANEKTDHIWQSNVCPHKLSYDHNYRKLRLLCDNPLCSKPAATLAYAEVAEGAPEPTFNIDRCPNCNYYSFFVSTQWGYCSPPWYTSNTSIVTIWTKSVTVPDNISGIKGYWTQITTSSTTPTPAQIKANGTFSATPDMTSPVAKTTKYAHIIAEDHAGNLSAALTVNLPACTCEIGEITLENPLTCQMGAEETDLLLSATAERSGNCTVPTHADTPISLTYSLTAGSENGGLFGNTLSVQNSGSFQIKVDASLTLATPKSKSFTMQVEKCTCDELAFAVSGSTLYPERSDADARFTFNPSVTSSCDIAAHNSLPTQYLYRLTAPTSDAAISGNLFTATKAGIYNVEIAATRNGYTAKKNVDVTVVSCSCTIDTLIYPDFSVDLEHDETDISLAATVVGSTSCGIPAHSGDTPLVTYSLNTPAEGTSVSGNTLTVAKSGSYSVKTHVDFNGDAKEIVTAITVQKCTCPNLQVSCASATLYLDRTMTEVSHDFHPTANSSCDVAAHNSIPTTFSYSLEGNRDGALMQNNTFTASKAGSFPVTVTAQHNGFTAQTTANISVVECTCAIENLDYPNFSVDLAHDETAVTLNASVTGSSACGIPTHSGNTPSLSYSLATPAEGASVSGAILTVAKSGVYSVKTTAAFNGDVKEITTSITIFKCTCNAIAVTCSPKTLYLDRTMSEVSHTLTPISDSSCDIAAHNLIATNISYSLDGNADGASMNDSKFTATKAGIFPVTITAAHNGFTAKTTVDMSVIGCSCIVQNLSYPDFSRDLAYDETDISLAATVVGSTSCGIPAHSGNTPTVTYSLNIPAEGTSISGNTLTVEKSGIYSVKTTAEFNGDVQEIVTAVTIRKCICNTLEINFSDVLAPIDDATGIATVNFTATANTKIHCDYTGHTNVTPESISYKVTDNVGDASISGDCFTATVPGIYTVEATLTLNGVENKKMGVVKVVDCACTFTPIQFDDFAIDIPADLHTESRTLSANTHSLNSCPVPSHQGKEPSISYSLTGTPAGVTLEGNLLTVTEDATFTVRATATLGKNSGYKDIAVTAKLLPLAPVFGSLPNDWTDQDVTVTLSAPNGGTILYTVNNGESKTYTQPILLEEDGSYSLNAWIEKHGETTDSVTPAPIKIDKSAPKSPVLSGVSGSGWYNAASPITAAIDPTTGSAETLLFQLNDGEWTEDAPAIDADGIYTLHAKTVDELHRESAVSECEMKLDMTAPVISGIEDGGTYYVDRVLYALDDNLRELLAEEQPSDEEKPEEIKSRMRTLPETEDSENSKLLPGNLPVDYLVTATDLAGNTTACTVFMRKIPDLKEPVADVDPDDLKPEDKGKIEEVIDNIDDILNDSPDMTPEQKDELETIKKELEDMLDKLNPPPTTGGGSWNNGGTTAKPSEPSYEKPYDPSTAPKGDMPPSDPPPRDLAEDSDTSASNEKSSNSTNGNKNGNTNASAPNLTLSEPTDNSLPLTKLVPAEAATNESVSDLEPAISSPEDAKKPAPDYASLLVISGFIVTATVLFLIGFWWLAIVPKRKKEEENEQSY